MGPVPLQIDNGDWPPATAVLGQVDNVVQDLGAGWAGKSSTQG